jgi:hypothetical protein
VRESGLALIETETVLGFGKKYAAVWKVSKRFWLRHYSCGRFFFSAASGRVVKKATRQSLFTADRNPRFTRSEHSNGVSPAPSPL